MHKLFSLSKTWRDHFEKDNAKYLRMQKKEKILKVLGKVYPVRNNAPLLPPSQRPSWPAAAAGLGFRIIPPACR
ncbi:MAG: hypothetical protein A2V86_07960 [Deltaproteobacteria bacterium RBG_16_49_23]|nr:MAG: hypothetical protein A2V86_07960 [Deltaproteobacteria bacterium RBG_16_49_23]